ncbi:hypothetical protein PF010_g11141 [Phytophthora fragariae]|uniref:RxLR effector protein n=1 Tax=Phytophthora fragariae TaxID=53985 RepID=A0A6A3KZ89_9STRA|nr:hypothetical protein PF003_g9968 [Phytophthora fragariae]KAE8945332.1 hypothetical protein PF009_g5020 [Phytophthora fragariae]KAE9008973.1 hypothetical protein PF011_g10480 [Phytophthora fragariae]KAE9110499.1 hypothetical protein PF010_g11141 [Phytophthora fragariae]KAE9248827.1 hypothetical protein PF002_g5576 [Phytophthora fragariae]
MPTVGACLLHILLVSTAPPLCVCGSANSYPLPLIPQVPLA